LSAIGGRKKKKEPAASGRSVKRDDSALFLRREKKRKGGRDLDKRGRRGRRSAHSFWNGKKKRGSSSRSRGKKAGA